jgi:hypothetical protein
MVSQAPWLVERPGSPHEAACPPPHYPLQEWHARLLTCRRRPLWLLRAVLSQPPVHATRHAFEKAHDLWIAMRDLASHGHLGVPIIPNKQYYPPAPAAALPKNQSHRDDTKVFEHLMEGEARTPSLIAGRQISANRSSFLMVFADPPSCWCFAQKFLSYHLVDAHLAVKSHDDLLTCRRQEGCEEQGCRYHPGCGDELHFQDPAVVMTRNGAECSNDRSRSCAEG